MAKTQTKEKTALTADEKLVELRTFIDEVKAKEEQPDSLLIAVLHETQGCMAICRPR